MAHFENIFERVTNVTEMSKEEILTKSRKKKYIRARMLFTMTADREMRTQNYYAIANVLGCDRSTVYNTIQRGYELLSYDKEFQAQLSAIETKTDKDYVQNCRIAELEFKNKELQNEIKRLKIERKNLIEQYKYTRRRVKHYKELV